MGCAASQPEEGAASLAADVSKDALPTSSSPDDVGSRKRSVMYKATEVGQGGQLDRETPFDDKRIGMVTRHGIAPTRGAGAPAKAKINQDRGVVCWPFNGSHNQALLCVFDGHGLSGERISEWCATDIPVRLESDHEVLIKDPSRSLTKHIVAMDKQMLSSPDLGATARGAGTTSNVLYFNGDKLWVACSGDSRAIMGQRAGGKIKAFDLSKDHKPDLPDEKRRIEKAGGVVSAAGPNGLPPSRVWVNGRVGLAMSRSLGDGEAKGHGVIPDPEIKNVIVKPAASATGDGDAFVVVASDGIWEFITSQQACDVVASHTSARAACDELVRLAEQRWKEEEGSYRDDITCIIVFLPFLENRGDENLPAIVSGNAEAGSNFMQKSDLEYGGVTDEEDTQKEKEKDEAESFVKRRLSIAGPSVDLDA